MQRLGIKAQMAGKSAGSAVDDRTSRGKGYALSLRRRRMIEETFDWIRTVGGLRKSHYVGLTKLARQLLFTFAAYYLTQLNNWAYVACSTRPASAPA